jgi:SAM-dependent methyltransferase
MNKLSNKIYSHFYPSWLIKYPWLIEILYVVNYLIHLRKWHIHSTISKKLNQIDFDFRLLDAGVGEGQFLMPLAKNYPNSHFTGLDKLAAHQIFCSAYAKSFKLNNVSFVTQELESFIGDQTFDVIICVGVLQYVQNDELVLNHFYNQLTHGGILLLYVPVNNKSILPFYTTLTRKMSNYETIQNRQRIYNQPQITAKLLKVGFTIEENINTYGNLGILSNELINTYLMLFNSSVSLFRILLTLIFILFYPMLLICMILDYFLPKKTGNGLLVIARK